MTLSTPPAVVAVCGDPGGANAVAPVLERFIDERRVTLYPLAYRQAANLWSQRGIANESLDESTGLDDCVRILRDRRTALVLAGTSVNGVELEKKFIAAARQLNIPSLVVLDFWSNYRRRFCDDSDRLVFVPDRVAVMDQQAWSEMIAAGFDACSLEITGQPAFDDLTKWRERDPEPIRQLVRSELGMDSRQRLVMFASQPLTELYGTDVAAPGHPGYTEFSVIAAVVAALDDLVERTGIDIVLLIRPHPRETNGKYAEFLGRRVRLIISSSQEARALVMAADVVTGMSSALLMDASYLGKLTLSFQPGLRLSDALPSNRWQMSKPVYRESEIAAVLEKALLDISFSRELRVTDANFILDGAATSRVVACAYRMLGMSGP